MYKAVRRPRLGIRIEVTNSRYLNICVTYYNAVLRLLQKYRTFGNFDPTAHLRHYYFSWQAKLFFLGATDTVPEVIGGGRIRPL